MNAKKPNAKVAFGRKAREPWIESKLFFKMSGWTKHKFFDGKN